MTYKLILWPKILIKTFGCYLFRMPNFRKWHFLHFRPLGWPLGVKDTFFSKTDNFAQFRRPKHTKIDKKKFFWKFKIFDKSVQSGNSKKTRIPTSYQVGDFFILLSLILTLNDMSISFIIFRSRFKFILTPLWFL